MIFTDGYLCPMLAFSIGLLGLLSLFGQVQLRYFADLPADSVTAVTVVALVLSGYLFFLFRDTLVASHRWHLRIVTFVVAVAAIAGVAVRLPAGAGAHYSPVQAAAVWLIVGSWAYCVGEPCLRLWFHARSLPVVQRMRARSISLGYGSIVVVLILVVVLLSAPQIANSTAFSYVVEGVVMLALPCIYAGLVPPAWLRRFWRESEEEKFREAIHRLLLDTPNASALAQQCLDWAVRLVGAESGCIVGLDGQMLATENLSHEQALMLAGASHHEEGRQALRINGDGLPSNVIVVPMESQFGKGAIAVVAGKFSPILGSDEVNRLTQYAASVTAAFDRLMTNCPKCNAEVQTSDNYCPDCGEPLTPDDE